MSSSDGKSDEYINHLRVRVPFDRHDRHDLHVLQSFRAELQSSFRAAHYRSAGADFHLNQGRQLIKSTYKYKYLYYHLHDRVLFEQHHRVLSSHEPLGLDPLEQ